jgi:hypothetical protein
MSITFAKAWKEYSERWDLDPTIEELESMKLGWLLARAASCQRWPVSEEVQPTVLYHFHCYYGQDHRVLDGFWKGTLTELEDYDDFKRELRASFNINDWDHIVITSLTKLS